MGIDWSVERLQLASEHVAEFTRQGEKAGKM
jgi:hypothetical protein